MVGLHWWGAGSFWGAWPITAPAAAPRSLVLLRMLMNRVCVEIPITTATSESSIKVLGPWTRVGRRETEALWLSLLPSSRSSSVLCSDGAPSLA